MADMENNATQNGETNTTEPTGTNGKEPKSFTQEEVDRIVQDRLAREKRNINSKSRIHSRKENRHLQNVRRL